MANDMTQAQPNETEAKTTIPEEKAAHSIKSGLAAAHAKKRTGRQSAIR